MSKHIDALVLIAHSTRISEEVPHFVQEDVEQGLWYVQSGEKKWYDGRLITETEVSNLYTSDVFLKLGRLTASIFKNEDTSSILNTNPFKIRTTEAIQAFSPLSHGEKLALDCGDVRWSSRLAENGLPETFAAALAQDPTIFDELVAKWFVAREVHKKRGKVTIPAYNLDELVDGLASVNLEEVAPNDISGSSYDMTDLIDHASIQTHLADFPYYATFREQENASEMLEHALEDLRSVSEAIQ